MKGIISDKLNPQALTIEEAETKIRILIKREIFRLTPKNDILGLAAVIIKNAVKELKLPVLKDAAQRSLWIFANNQYNIIRSSLENNLLLAAAFISVLGENGEATLPKTRAKEIIRQYAPAGAACLLRGAYAEIRAGLSERKRKTGCRQARKVISEKSRTISAGEIPCWNRAEVEVRYARHQEELEELKAKRGKTDHRIHACGLFGTVPAVAGARLQPGRDVRHDERREKIRAARSRNRSLLYDESGKAV